MISLTLEDYSKNLDESSMQMIFEQLGVTPPNISSFLENSEDERDFYAFFFDVLIKKDMSCAIDIDWKWTPGDMFWQLEKYLSEAGIKLLKAVAKSDKVFEVHYRCNGTTLNLLVDVDNPGLLLDSIAEHLEDKQFIEINFLEDRHSWLITPKDFNIERFCALTGLDVEKPKPRPEAPQNFAEGYKQTTKIFFRPTIIYVSPDQIGYSMPNQTWSGRILPGQTIREGIATELKTELNYSGRFNYSYDGFEGVFKDRRGQDIKRYRLIVYLYDKTFQSKMAGGADIKLQKITDKNFSFPRSDAS